MPLAAAVPILANGLVPLFATPAQFEDNLPKTADTWAGAYVAYSLNSVNTTPIAAKRPALAAALVVAFNPDGAGKSKFIQALGTYWLGTPAPAIPGVVSIFTPSGSIDSVDVSEDATPLEQATAIADLIHQFTVSSAKIVHATTGAIIPVA